MARQGSPGKSLGLQLIHRPLPESTNSMRRSQSVQWQVSEAPTAGPPAHHREASHDAAGHESGRLNRSCSIGKADTKYLLKYTQQ